MKWNNPKLQVSKLQFRKAGAPAGSNVASDWFSFDLGGTLSGGSAEGDVFLAECKSYKGAADQHDHYKDFLANCYLVQNRHGAQYDHFMWLTWAPFQITEWPTLLSPGKVKEAVHDDADSKYTALGADPYDPTIGDAVAAKVMIVVLADRQEVTLSLHDPELMYVRKALLEARSH